MSFRLQPVAAHYFPPEHSRNCVSFAHGYSSNIHLPSCKSRLICTSAYRLPLPYGSGCTLHYQMEMERFELLTPCLQGRCSPNWATPPYNPGIHLLSHAVSSIVPSAAQVLTVVFGMGTGVSPVRIDTRNLWVPLWNTQQCLKLLLLP